MEKPGEESLGGAGVLDKYTAAGKVARRVMEEVIARLAPGADIYELSRWGTSRITELCKEHFPAKKMEKGVAFPVCISPNEIVDNFAPLREESMQLSAGDVAKVELGVQFDGYPVILAHSVIVGAGAAEEQRLLRAGYLALLAGVKALAANRECSRVSQLQQAVGRALELNFLEGSATTEVRRYLLHGGQAVFSQPRLGVKADNFTFKANEVYSVEALVSFAPESRAKAAEKRTTVFHRKIDAAAEPKTAMGRQLLREVRDKYSDMSFALNAWDDEPAARLGATDCLNNGLIEALPVSVERSRARVAHFRWTVGVSGKRLLVLAGLPDPRLEEGPAVALEDEQLQRLFDVSVEALTAKPVPPPKAEPAK